MFTLTVSELYCQEKFGSEARQIGDGWYYPNTIINALNSRIIEGDSLSRLSAKQRALISFQGSQIAKLDSLNRGYETRINSLQNRLQISDQMLEFYKAQSAQVSRSETSKNRQLTLLGILVLAIAIVR